MKDERATARPPGAGIHVTAESAVAYTDGRIPEQYVLDALRSATDVSADSDELMGSVKNWPSYYHLGVGRSVIIRCLDLPSQARVLEIGAGCGAITRYLGENFSSVDAIEGNPDRAPHRARALPGPRQCHCNGGGSQIRRARTCVRPRRRGRSARVRACHVFGQRRSARRLCRVSRAGGERPRRRWPSRPRHRE